MNTSDKPARLMSLDAYRGFIMLAMASSLGGALVQVARNTGHSADPWMKFLIYQFDHAAWTGCAFWDLIQPSFMFMVGVALPYSYASRKARGDSEARIFCHTLVRSLVLIGLGIFLVSNGRKETDFTFVNVLTQIGLGYPFVYLLVNRGRKVQLAMLASILVGYWLAFALYPLPPADFDWNALKVTEAERFDGFFVHWNKNENFAAWFDRWFLNKFPRHERYEFNAGGYQTLNFVPSMATMLLGLMAGELLRGPRGAGEKLGLLFLAGAVCLGLGQAADLTVCPSIKRIWTPAWALYSSGWTFWMLGGFFAVIDILGYRAWAFPLVVVGMNSIAMYCMAQVMKPWLRQTWQTHLGTNVFGGDYGPLLQTAAVLFSLWLICYWLYRQRIFIRI